MTSARLFLLHRLLLVVAAFAVALAATQPASPGRLPARLVAGTAAPAQFRPLEVPVRILDTRPQYSVPNLGYWTPFGEGAMRQVQVTSMGGGLPSSGITAVVMNVTVTNGSSASYLKIYPSGAAAPNTSFLNWGPDQVKPNLVQVEVGPDGLIDVVNQLGTVDVIMDVSGYFTTAGDTSGLYNPLAPTRIFDTRPLYGPIPAGGRGNPIGQGETMDVTVAGLGGVPATGAEAVVLNVTVTNTTSESFLAAWPSNLSKPNASNLNWFATHTEPNRVIVPLGSSGKISLFNSLGTADVFVDVDGWFSDGSVQTTGQRMMSVPPVRIFDTRPQFGPVGAYMRPLAKGEWRTVAIAGALGVPAMTDAVAPSAVVLNVTVTGTSEASFLSAYPPAATLPNVSDLNWAPGETVPNMVVVKLADDGSVRVYNSQGCTDVIFDLVGWYTGPTVVGSTPPQPSAQADCILPPPPPAPRAPKPVTLHIPSQNIHSHVEEVGADANGTLGSPSNIWDAGWFNGMPRPGENGDAIMSGHVDWYNSPYAAFTNLQYVQIGAEIFVDREDGSRIRFLVDNKVSVPYQNPPPWVFSSDPPSQLTLITCSGYWDGYRYTQRLAVHAHIG